MSNNSVLLTGSEGVVGKVLTGFTIADGERANLDAQITRVDIRQERGSAREGEDWRGLPYNNPAYVDNKNPFIQSDLKDELELESLLRAYNVVIHGAWANEGMLDPESHDLENIVRTLRLLNVAVGIGSSLAPKFILFSSVNAHVPRDWRSRRNERNFITLNEPSIPYVHNRDGQPGPGTTKYGWSKLALEALAKDYAQKHGLDMYVARLGGLNMADQLSSKYEPHRALAVSERGKHFDIDWEDAVRLRHHDFVGSIQAQVDAPTIPGKFELVQIVSDSPRRVHEI
jgi:nucleoside-diphosphate-sugar epimerase